MSYRSYVISPPAQTEPLDARQVPNNAGGYAYQIDPWKQLTRFLVLGSEGGTYYVSERKLTKQNATVINTCLVADAKRTIDHIVEVSESGRAPKNDPAIFALAIAASYTDPTVRAYALAGLPKVCRIPTHLFHFCEYLKGQRGWGRGLRRAVARWYNENPSLAYHLVKYQSRDGWSNRDVLRKAHPSPVGDLQQALFKYVAKSEWTSLPAIVDGFEQAKTAEIGTLIKLIREVGLTREMLPTEALKHPQIWEALLVKMPMQALVRNLSTMTRVGLLTNLSRETKEVVSRLQGIKGSRVHPLQILNALKTYQSGRGTSSTWTPVRAVIDALNDAFYAAFGEVTPTNKNLMLALDVSGSMGSGQVGGTALTPREACAALALITANVEKSYEMCAFAGTFIPLTISPTQRLDDVVRLIDRLDFGSTDCALPMISAQMRRLGIDAFSVFTDSETWVGRIHPMQALRSYRMASGIDAKLIVVGMTSTGFTIGDPQDPGCLDVVGFDLATPEILSGFITGRL